MMRQASTPPTASAPPGRSPAARCSAAQPVVIDRIRPGELEGIVNPAMDGYLGALRDERDGVRADARRAGNAGVIGMGRGPGRPAYTSEEIEAAQRIADAAADRTASPAACSRCC